MNYLTIINFVKEFCEKHIEVQHFQYDNDESVVDAFFSSNGTSILIKPPSLTFPNIYNIDYSFEIYIKDNISSNTSDDYLNKVTTHNKSVIIFQELLAYMDKYLNECLETGGINSATAELFSKENDPICAGLIGKFTINGVLNNIDVCKLEQIYTCHVS